MAESSEIEEKSFWDELFGFRIGERVKVRFKAYSWRRDSKPYWRYGTVKRIRVNRKWKLSIKLDGNRYNSYFYPKDLIRVKSRKEL